ncbi:Alpha/Beta hydrolase protein [Aspergillus varians]
MRLLQALTVAAITAQCQALGDVVNLGYAKYKGVTNKTTGITKFSALRYAAAPVGDLRWREPVPIETVLTKGNGQPLNATVRGPVCHNTNPGWAIELTESLPTQAVATPDPSIVYSEDCLLLDVVAPAKPNSKKLPVIIQIHGGGYVSGNSESPDGSVFVQQSKGNIVWVQIQYRLGPYGFLAGSEVQADGTANAGLLDQRLALEWVKNHIAAFGGDPDQITIWGGSAGGGSVVNQMILHGGQSNPPFAAAIAEYPWTQTYHDAPTIEAQYNELLDVAGCDNLACLRALPSDQLVNASQTVYLTAWANKNYGFGDFYFTPSVDGKVVQGLPSEEIKAGHFSKVPFLTNRAPHEGILFSQMTMKEESEIQPDLEKYWGVTNETFYQTLLDLYPASDFTSPPTGAPHAIVSLTEQGNLTSVFFRRAAIIGDYSIVCPTNDYATALSAQGVPVYKMAFNAGTQLHASTLAYLFAADSVSGNPTLSAQMKEWFISFIMHRDPNAYATISKAAWPLYGSEKQVLNVDEYSLSTISDPDANERCAFLNANAHLLKH